MIRLLIAIAAVQSHRRNSRAVADADLQLLIENLRIELQCTRPIEIRESPELSTAATIGWRRPLILLPVGWRAWNQQQVRAVLSHEMAHISHNDFPAWLCAQIGLVLHYYHPMVHWLAARLRLEQEFAADARAAALAGGESYLTSLAELALHQSDRRVTCLASTFLPTSRTFMRRIEMLRKSKRVLTKLSVFSRSIMVTVILLAGIAAAGFRSPEVELDESRQGDPVQNSGEKNDNGSDSNRENGNVFAENIATQPQLFDAGLSPADATKTRPFNLAYVPSDAVAVIAVRPSAILSRPELSPIAKAINDWMKEISDFGIPIEQIEQIIAAPTISESRKNHRGPMPAFGGMIIRVSKPNDLTKMAQKAVTNAQKAEFEGQTYYRQSASDGGLAYFMPDKQTLVFDIEADLKMMMKAGRSGGTNLAWAKAWKNVAHSHFAVAVEHELFRKEIGRELRVDHEPLFAAFAPLWEKSTTVVAGVSFEKTISVKVFAACQDETSAVTVKDTLGALVPLARNLLAKSREQAGTGPVSKRRIMRTAIEFGDELVRSVKITQDGNVVSLSATARADAIAPLMSMFSSSIRRARNVARRAQDLNNLKQLGLAFHNYHATYHRFPPAVVVGRDGKTLHSWRVELLPFLGPEAQAVHRLYRMDEAWDSDHNKRLIAKMPAAFRNPRDTANSTNSSYFALTGSNTVFSKSDGTRIRDIRDGTSNTILVVEARRAIPWTKPEDIPYDAKKPLPKLGGFQPGGFGTVFCDGSARFMMDNLNSKVLRAMISNAGGELFDLPSARGTDRPAAQPPTSEAFRDEPQDPR